MKTLTIKINDSAHRKLQNLMKRMGYRDLGDLIAYLVKQENKRTQEQANKKK